jgi:hypothetical protein
MSAFSSNKVVCRVYGNLFLLIGVMALLLGGLLIYMASSNLSDWKVIADSPAFEGLDQKTFEVVTGWGGALCLVAAVIPIVLGVLAWLRYVWAMIVGTALWIPLFGHGLMGGFAQPRMHKFDLVSTLVLVLLTIAAVACRRRTASLTQTPSGAAAG